MRWLHTRERRPAIFSRGVQAGRRCLRAAVLRVAAVLLRRVAHVKRGGLGFLIPFHSLRVEPCAQRNTRIRFASFGGGRHSADENAVSVKLMCTIFFVSALWEAFRRKKRGEEQTLQLSFVVRLARRAPPGRVRLSPTRVSSCRGGAAVRPYPYRQHPTKGADTGGLPRYPYCSSMAMALVADCSHRRRFRRSPRWHCR